MSQTEKYLTDIPKNEKAASENGGSTTLSQGSNEVD
jgi:hypothetical protein